MPDNIAKELDDIGNRLDQQIRNDLIANATIDFITSVLSDVAGCAPSQTHIRHETIESHAPGLDVPPEI